MAVGERGEPRMNAQERYRTLTGAPDRARADGGVPDPVSGSPSLNLSTWRLNMMAFTLTKGPVRALGPGYSHRIGCRLFGKIRVQSEAGWSSMGRWFSFPDRIDYEQKTQRTD